MNIIKKFFIRKKIKKELKQMIAINIDLKNKNMSSLKKTDLDSVDLMTLLALVEKKWGQLNLADLYQAEDFDDIADLIIKKLQ